MMTDQSKTEIKRKFIASKSSENAIPRTICECFYKIERDFQYTGHVNFIGIKY